MKFSVVAVVTCSFLLSAGGRAQQPSPQQQTAQQQTPQETPQKPLEPRQREELRGDVLVARKLYPEAIAVYEKLLREDSRNAVLLNKIGIAYHQQMMLAQAKRYYERAIKADKTYASAVNNLGTVEYHRHKYRQAIRVYRKALALSPYLSATYSNLGYAYFAQKKYEDALVAFRHALELDPMVFDRRDSAGAVLQDRSVADHGFFYFFLAKSFATLGNAERCAYYLRKARDEGYKNFAAAEKDPAFAAVIKDPQVQQVLQPNPPATPAPKTPGL